jgi:hypothetical protein
MVQPNYAFQKRQRDLAKKQKKEEKKMKKASGQDTDAPAEAEPSGAMPPAPGDDKSPP